MPHRGKNAQDDLEALDAVSSRIEIEDNNLGGPAARPNFFSLQLFRNRYKEEIRERDIRAFQARVVKRVDTRTLYYKNKPIDAKEAPLRISVESNVARFRAQKQRVKELTRAPRLQKRPSFVRCAQDDHADCRLEMHGVPVGSQKAFALCERLPELRLRRCSM